MPALWNFGFVALLQVFWIIDSNQKLFIGSRHHSW